jgi:hypothetical protein
MSVHIDIFSLHLLVSSVLNSNPDWIQIGNPDPNPDQESESGFWQVKIVPKTTEKLRNLLFHVSRVLC